MAVLSVSRRSEFGRERCKANLRQGGIPETGRARFGNNCTSGSERPAGSQKLRCCSVWEGSGSKTSILSRRENSQSHGAWLQGYSEITPNKEIPTMPLTTDQKMLTLSSDVIEAFDKADRGPHPGFRPAHAKGILLTGEFKPSPEAVGLTRAPHVQRVSVPVTVRFSDFGGVPTVADNSQNAGPRGFALRFYLAEHVHTDIVAHSVDSFPTRTADEFLEFINALVATDPAGPHPNAIERFLGKHPAALAFCGLSRQHSTLPRDANLVVRPMNNSGRGPITHLKAIGHLQADATESV